MPAPARLCAARNFLTGFRASRNDGQGASARYKSFDMVVYDETRGQGFVERWRADGACAVVLAALAVVPLDSGQAGMTDRRPLVLAASADRMVTADEGIWRRGW